MSQELAEHALQVASLSPYPTSFAGSGTLFFWALLSVTGLAVMNAMICGWMVRELWRDRRYTRLSNKANTLRIIIGLVTFTATLRALPEAVMLSCWGEVSESTMMIVITMKRFMDGLAIFPGLIWGTIFALAYPALGHRLRGDIIETDLLPRWPAIARPLLAFMLIVAIAAIVSVGKALRL